MLELVCGWELREAVGYQVATFSAIRRTTEPLRFVPLMENALRYQGLYKRPHEQRDGQLWDVISDAPMSTSFACSRFLTPWLAENQWALFCDFADMMFLTDPVELFELADERYAVMVVKRKHDVSRETSGQSAEAEGVSAPEMKMDGQIQTSYPRKNWSSVILWNLAHPANVRGLTHDMVNSLPGRDLHRFCWLRDDEIGELPPEWNFLVGVDDLTIKPKLLHFTLGLPSMGRDDAPWADVWKQELAILDSTRGTLRAPFVNAEVRDEGMP